MSNCSRIIVVEDDAYPKKNHMLAVVIGATVLIAILSAVVVFMLLRMTTTDIIGKKEPNSSKKKEKAISIENSSLLVQTQLLYAKINKTNNTSEIYRRPPGGDTNVKVVDIPAIISSEKYSRLSNDVAFIAGAVVYASNDSGVSFKKIYSAPQGEDITSLRFSKRKAKLAIAVTQAYGTMSGNTKFSSQVISMDVDGKNQKQLFTSQDIGLYIKDWSLEANKVLYQAGCNRCDQAPRITQLYDLKSKKTTDVPIEDNHGVGNLLLNDDASKVTYSQALHDPNIRLYSGVQEDYYGPPYSLHQYTIESGTDKLVNRIGKKVAKPSSPSDIPPQPKIATAGTQYGRQHYYVYGQTISLLFDDKTTKALITIPGKIRDVLFVSEAQVLATIGDDSSWKLTSFDVKGGGEQVLFSGDATIIPLGMSDQF